MFANGLRVAAVGDFKHKFSYEEPQFKFTNKCHTKHCTANCGNTLLPVRASVIRVLLSCPFEHCNWTVRLLVRHGLCGCKKLKYRRAGEKNGFPFGKQKKILSCKLWFCI